MEVRDEHIPEATFAECLDRMPQTCVELVLVDDGRVLVARRTNPPAEGEYFWPGSRLYKGERLDDAAHRVAREELGVEVELDGQFGVYEHFWDTVSVEGLDSRHTVNVVYRADRTGDGEITLDEQHDDYRWVGEVEPWMNDHVREYLEDGAIPDA